MRGYKIESIEAHKASLAKDHEDQIRRLDYDIEDVALSSWATSQMATFHSFAIRALELGAKNGIDGPAVLFPILRYFSNEKIVEARLVHTAFGPRWLVAGNDRDQIGKTWLSTNEKTLEKLGLYEDCIVLPAKSYADAYSSCLGAPVTFSLKPAPGAFEAVLNGLYVPKRYVEPTGS